MVIWLVLLLALLEEAVASKSRCYSCASSNLQSNFLSINRGPMVRKENPKVFDNFCNGDTWIIREKSLVDCDGPCFKWQQIVNNSGDHSVMTIRGCYSKMFDLTKEKTPKSPEFASCTESKVDLNCLADANVIEHSCWCQEDQCNKGQTLRLPMLLLSSLITLLCALQ
ncbi:hypothetical protein L596_027735 [Steinernema carpocapsae]|uniref:Protein quiver n=1 Tax=Steinernema carpocapsae TaxID=34508 RepID=A0A4V5ZXN6_STECR|nr:hypothetical protein L596_027735 [Steinernema carpocapsae]